MPLASVLPPGYRAFEAVKQANEQGELADLQKAQLVRGMLAQMQAQQKQKQYEAAMSGLGPTATPEQQIAAARPFLGPKEFVDFTGRQEDLKQKALDRQEAAKQRAFDVTMAYDLKQQELDRRREADRQRTTDANARQAFEEQYKRDSLRLQQERALWERIFQQQGLDIKRLLAERSTEKPLPGPLQKQLTESAELADATQRFVGTFKDDYAGYTLGAVGDAVNWAKRTFGDESGQAQWWQDYELHQSQVRNKLFGSALTAPEIAAWNKSAINPGMDPTQVRENLGRRDKLEKIGIERLMKGAAAGGYKKEQIEAFTGRSLSAPAAETPTAPPTVDSLLEKYK